MKLVPTVGLAVLVCLLPGFAAIDLGGKVLQLDSLPKKGVIVSLSGTKLSDTTDDKGEWSFVDDNTGIHQRHLLAHPVSNHLVFRNGRIQLSLAGRDALGRHPQPVAASTSFPTVAARTTATGTFDTLVYSWNGKTILRDTIAHDALSRKGIFRHFDTTVNPAITHGYVSDGQGHLYRTVSVGKQVWMAENLYTKADSSWCYKDSAALCPAFGRLYQWTALFGASPVFNYEIRGKKDTLLQGICPQGWRIPSDADFVALLEAIDSGRSGILLRSTQGWLTPEGQEIHDGSDSLGFHTPASGYRNSNGDFGNLHTHAAFWTTSETDKPNTFREGKIGSYVWTSHFYGMDAFTVRLENYKDLGMSARCIQGAGAPN